MPSVDLVIPSYGGPIKETLGSVNLAGMPDKTYVIDNARRFRDPPLYAGRVVWVDPCRNIGWEAGLNAGTAMSDADYVIWMNDDVQPETKDWHLKLVEPMEEDPSIALVGPLVRGHNNFQGRLSTMLPDPHPLLWDLSPVYDMQGFPEEAPDVMPAFRISFFCVAVRRAAWHDIGPVDDRFSVPATGRRGGDDYDYSWRAELAGWDQVCRTDVWVNHVDQGQTYRMLNATLDNTPLLKEKWGWS
jgi:GT2 family glycosyltransferase